MDLWDYAIFYVLFAVGEVTNLACKGGCVSLFG